MTTKWEIERLGLCIPMVVEYTQTHRGHAATRDGPGEANEYDIASIVVTDDCEIEAWRGLRFAAMDLPSADYDALMEALDGGNDVPMRGTILGRGWRPDPN